MNSYIKVKTKSEAWGETTIVFTGDLCIQSPSDWVKNPSGNLWVGSSYRQETFSPKKIVQVEVSLDYLQLWEEEWESAPFDVLCPELDALKGAEEKALEEVGDHLESMGDTPTEAHRRTGVNLGGSA